MSPLHPLRRTPRAFAVAVLAACLSACGGGGDSDPGATETAASAAVPPDPTAQQYLPTVVGAQWVYADSQSKVPVTLTATGQRLVDGRSGVVVRSSLPTEADSVLLETDVGVWAFPGETANAITHAIGAVQRLRYPLIAGDRYVGADKALTGIGDIDGDGKPDVAWLRSESEVVGFESRDTPAGRFDDSLHLRRRVELSVALSSLGHLPISMLIVTDEWLARGVGLVDSESRLGKADGPPSSTRRLTAYSVGPRQAGVIGR